MPECGLSAVVSLVYVQTSSRGGARMCHTTCATGKGTKLAPASIPNHRTQPTCLHKRPSPPPRVPRPSSVVLIHPGAGNVALAQPWSCHASSSITAGSVEESTLKGSPSWHTFLLPQPPLVPPPPPSPPRVLHHHPCFKLHVIPHLAAMDAVETELKSTLVGGTQPLVLSAQVQQYLSCFF
jgi:hypothetical protein